MPPEVERILRGNLALNAQISALVLELKSSRGSRPKVSPRTRALQVFAYLLTCGDKAFQNYYRSTSPRTLAKWAETTKASAGPESFLSCLHADGSADSFREQDNLVRRDLQKRRLSERFFYSFEAAPRKDRSSSGCPGIALAETPPPPVAPVRLPRQARHSRRQYAGSR